MCEEKEDISTCLDCIFSRYRSLASDLKVRIVADDYNLENVKFEPLKCCLLPPHTERDTDGDIVTVYPVICTDDWCGEWKEIHNG